jgi:broad specificity phosphatase PhoE
MSRIFLLRHAHSQANAKNILAGRKPGIALSDKGQQQISLLANRFEGAKFDKIISSPIQRCLETLSFLEAQPTIIEDFQEVDYGTWTGKRMSSLARNKAWQEIHKHPASVRFPQGETLPEVQTRSLLGLSKINPKSKNVLIATHADVVKVLILHALGTHLNNIDKLQIDNASVSILDMNGNDLRVVRVNDVDSIIKEHLK